MRAIGTIAIVIATILATIVHQHYAQQQHGARRNKITINSDSASSNSNSDMTCYAVRQGDFYSNHTPIGIRSSQVYEFSIMFRTSSARYLFAPTDEKGHLCSTSWNKLVGSSRCGPWVPHHDDSDRFVWRRSQECLIYNGTHVTGVKSNCSSINQIELAAYAYDHGQKPFEHIGTLLKEFKHKVNVEEWYTYKITFDEQQTTYLLSDSNKVPLEGQVIKHRSCSLYKYGYKLWFYFGGQCPAPQEVAACYKQL